MQDRKMMDIAGVKFHKSNMQDTKTFNVHMLVWSDLDYFCIQQRRSDFNFIVSRDC